MNAIKLNFINNSSDTNNSQVVIFQKNEAAPNAPAIAWKVIKNCVPGHNYPFTFPLQTHVAVEDSQGNLGNQHAVTPGQVYSVEAGASGHTLTPAGPATGANRVEVLNNTNQQTVTARIYRDQQLLATEHNVAPGQTAAFEFKPAISISVSPGEKPGHMLYGAIISNVNTELALEGIASADIIMDGGGPDPNPPPFSFSLQNVQYA